MGVEEVEGGREKIGSPDSSFLIQDRPPKRE
jgi:hypothetical protein